MFSNKTNFCQTQKKKKLFIPFFFTVAAERYDPEADEDDGERVSAATLVLNPSQWGYLILNVSSYIMPILDITQ